MESFARRGIRTTVAVAGLAALGVGLAAPAFALPGVPDIGGIGNTQPAADHAGSPADATDAMGALPGAFAFQPPAADQSAPASDSAQSDTAQPADDTQTDSTQAEPQSETTESDSTAADSTDATDSDATQPEAAPAEQAPAPNPGLLPQIPGSPVAAQTTPNVSGINPGSALQGLDSGSLF